MPQQIWSPLSNPALSRHFDNVFSIPPPGPVEIESFLRLTLSAVQFEQPQWSQLVASWRGLSAAMVVKAAQDAAKAAVLAGGKVLTHAMLVQAMKL